MPGARATLPLPALLLSTLSGLAGCGEATGVGAHAAAPPPLPPPLAFATLPPMPWLDEAAARALYPALDKPEPRMAYDPRALLVLEPDRRDSFAWPEHPRGRIVFVTNDLGLREDTPVRPGDVGRCVLVLGDSHTEGLVHNQESFAHVLQALLGAAGRPTRVLNAGVGTTAPQNYLGQYLRLEELRPALVVAVVYDGNDFAGALQLDERLRGLPTTHPPAERLAAARARWPEILPQAFGQALQFAAHPDAAGRALDAALEALLELQRQCAHRGARLLVATLPAKPDVDGDDRATQAELLATLGLEAQDLAVNEALGARLRAALADAGVEALDLAPVLKARPGPMYWVRDYHLAVAGHEAVGLALARRVVTGR